MPNDWIIEHSLEDVSSEFTNVSKLAVLFSGGIDSTTIIGEAINDIGFKVYPMSFDDGSVNYKTRRSVAVEQIVGHYSLQQNHHVIKMYDSEFLRMKGTFGLIPGYKLLMQIAAMSYCQKLGIKFLAMGYCKENDEYPYTFKDEQPEYLNKIADLYNTIYDAKINILLPYLNKTKSDIIGIAVKNEVPLEKTISCRSTTFGGLIHCGKCLPCHSRRSGFVDSGRIDPTIYHYSADEMEEIMMETTGTVVINPNERYKV